MKCNHALQRLLATSGPRRPAEDVRAHLDECAACRRFAERLDEIDAGAKQLPVPNSRAAKAALIDRVLSPAIVAHQPRRGWSWAHVAAAAAALVVIGAFVASAFRGRPVADAAPATDPLLARVLDRHAELAAADSIERRVEVLELLSGDLDTQARGLAYVASTDDLNVLADLYVSVVGGEKGLLARADEVPVGQRRQILEGLASRFRDAGAATAKKSTEVPPSATAPLMRIAAAARDAHSALNREVRDERAALEQQQHEKLAQEAPPRPGEGKS